MSHIYFMCVTQSDRTGKLLSLRLSFLTHQEYPFIVYVPHILYLCNTVWLYYSSSSSDSITFCIPHIKTKTFGHRSFSYAASSVWNSLPHEIRHIQSTIAVKIALKTHWFKSYLCYLNLYCRHLFLWILSFDLLCVVCVCVCVCVCVWCRLYLL